MVRKTLTTSFAVVDVIICPPPSLYKTQMESESQHTTGGHDNTGRTGSLECLFYVLSTPQNEHNATETTNIKNNTMPLKLQTLKLTDP